MQAYRFCSCGLFSLGPLYDFALHASLQIQDETPSEEGNTRWPHGHPPSVLSKEKEENLPLLGFRSWAICFLLVFAFFLSSLPQARLC